MWMPLQGAVILLIRVLPSPGHVVQNTTQCLSLQRQPCCQYLLYPQVICYAYANVFLKTKFLKIPRVAHSIHYLLYIFFHLVSCFWFSSLKSQRLYQFPRTIVTNSHKLGDQKQQKYTLHGSGGLISKIKVATGMCTCQRLQGRIRSLRLPALGNSRWSLAVAASLRCVPPSLLVLLPFCLLLRILSTGFRASLVSQLVKNLPANAGDPGLIPGSGRLPGEGNGYPLQYSCLGKSRNRGSWQATVHGVAKNQTHLKQLCVHVGFCWGQK